MIYVLDIGSGNVSAFLNAFRKLGVEAKVFQGVGTPEDVSGVVFPGVGDFGVVMARLVESKGLEFLEREVVKKGVPFLGVCIGMQVLGMDSEESRTLGLGWIEGSVKKIPKTLAMDLFPVPQMGWNNLEIRPTSMFFDPEDRKPYAYFIHSYFFDVTEHNSVHGFCDYSVKIPSLIVKNNLVGTQFHPEKSGKYGLSFLKKFLEFKPC